MSKIENFLDNASNEQKIEILAEMNDLTTEEFRQFLFKVNSGISYIRFDSEPWWRRRYYAIAPPSPFTLRKPLRRWTRLGILYAMYRERERRVWLAQVVGLDDTEWSDW